MKYFVTGAGGFIGSNMVDRLLDCGHQVVGYDNWSTGQPRFLANAMNNQNFTFIEGDVLNIPRMSNCMNNVEAVLHFAANADVRHGTEHTYKDLEQNTIGTWSVLEAMRKKHINKIVFSSTGSVYGESKVIPTPENVEIPVQTSLYGASKMASEGLIQAYCEAFNMQSWIFRFVSVLGERYSHGHIFDFYKQLKSHPDYLNVLGNGEQRKSYIYVQDVINGILCALSSSSDKVNVFNLGTNDTITVKESIGIIIKNMNVKPSMSLEIKDRGWIGDNPLIYLDVSKIQSLGWNSDISIEKGITHTLDYLKNNEWLLENK